MEHLYAETKNKKCIHQDAVRLSELFECMVLKQCEWFSSLRLWFCQIFMTISLVMKYNNLLWEKQ